MTKEEFMKSPFDFKFEVDPLDVHICEMQFNLNKRVKVEGPQEGVPFQPLVERYVSKDPTREFGEMTVTLQEADKKGEFELVFTVHSKQGGISVEHVMHRGDWEEICQFIDKASLTYGKRWGFLSRCKAHALWLDHCIKNPINSA